MKGQHFHGCTQVAYLFQTLQSAPDFKLLKLGRKMSLHSISPLSFQTE